MEEWDDYDEDETSRPIWKRPVLWAAAVAVVIAIAAVGYIALNKDDGSPSEPASLGSTAPTNGSAPVTTTAGSSTSIASTTTSSATTIATPTTVEPSTVPPTTVSAVETTLSVAVTAAPTDTAAATTVASANVPTYATLPDGSPAPIIAVFNTDSITLTGAVPSEETKNKLQGLAIANSKFPVPVNNLLTIDPSVPMGIGVRVVELTSTRFPPNSSKIETDHARELDRIVSIMNALPNVTALIIGHADQVGSQANNFKISSERAAAVVNYLVFMGVNPDRLASRAVGDTDLLTLNDDAASLALNRRTEVVFSGLLSS